MIQDLLHTVVGFFARNALLVALDLCDILVVSFLIYRVLALLKGTRAMQTGIGLALIFAVYYAARRIGFMTLWSILDGLITYIVLIVVILFQNDIRRALMRMGGASFLIGPRGAKASNIVAAVVRAATSLAQKRIGALVVFERDAILDEFIEPGVMIDAEVNKELLYSMFVPSYENPLHDGAAIIREGRLAQAGAFLPLTSNPDLDRNLGTRHRAALGLSEETDAVVVVVSEERGAISLCFNSNIVRNLDGESLRLALNGLLRIRASRKEGASSKSSEVSTLDLAAEPTIPATPKQLASTLQSSEEN